MKKFWAIFFTTVALSLSCEATEIIENFINARALGMGNAFAAVADDYTSLWYNPAGLNRIHGFHFILLGLNVGTDATDIYSIYTNTTGTNYAATIHQYFGRPVWLGVEDALAGSMKDFAFAGYNYLNMDFDLRNPAFPNISMTLNNDIGGTAGVAVPLLPDDAFVLGAAVKRITRYGGQVNLGASTLASLSNTAITNLINSYGTGWGIDAGVTIEIPTGIHPALSAVWQNIGQTTFYQSTGGASYLVPMDNNAIAGFSMLFDASLVKVRPSFQYDHINIQSEQLGKKIHAGIEFVFPGLSLRAGANQGYYTVGVGLDFKYVKFDAASYGVELDTYPGQFEDRRYIVQMTVDLNADLTFDYRKDGVDKSYQRR